MEARNRNLGSWYSRIKSGEIKLPRFQRFEAWDRQRIGSLLEMVIRGLPAGITLILEVGENEKFVSRFLETATPQPSNGRVLEHLLDGQQRLTALWRAFHNNYEDESYYVYLAEFDEYTDDIEREDMSIYSRSRYVKSNGERYPLWCDDPAECLCRGMIPTHLLRPDNLNGEVDKWIQAATAGSEPTDNLAKLKAHMQKVGRIGVRLRELCSTVANYNLPFLSLPSDTDKSVAVEVFIKMNSNSKPLSQYDYIVAEVEDVMGTSLHEMGEAIEAKHPEIARYQSLSDLVLTTSALLQGHLPNQRGAWDMDKRVMVENWRTMERGLMRMAQFLESEGIYDEQRLPTNAVLAPIAALYAAGIPDSGDKRGQDELLLKKFLWYAFFTNRYENSAASRAFSDYKALRGIIAKEHKENSEPYALSDVPIFLEPLAEADELLKAEWPKRASIRGRGVLAVVCRLGALDFATGQRLAATEVGDRHYHHLFPTALLDEAKVDGFLALNCALIRDMTNITIGRKEPLAYLKDRYQWTTQAIVRERLQSHLIPIEELANGGYEGLSEQAKTEKIRRDFDAFLRRRAELVLRAAKTLAEGRQLSASGVYGT